MENKFIYTSALDKIRSMNSRIKVCQGGSSAGKTFAIIPILIDMAARHSNTSISIVSESFPQLRKGAMRDFLNIMKMTNRYVDSHWNRTNSIYNFHNGSYIEFFPADSADKLRGGRRNVLFINECNNITQDAYIQLAMRTSDDIFLDYNPSHRFWIDDVLKSDEAERIILTYRDNQGLPDNVKQYLESKRELAKTSDYWDNWCKVYLDGQQGHLEGVVFNDWKICDYIPDDAKLIGYGLDFGYSNDPTALIGVYLMDDEIYLDQLIYQTQLTNADIIKLLKDLNIKGEIIADSAEPKSIREISMGGFNIRGAKKGKDSIVYGIGLMQERQIHISKRSNYLIEEFERYSWKVDRSGVATNIPVDNWNHGIDAVRYILLTKLNKGSIPFSTTSERRIRRTDGDHPKRFFV